MATHLNSNFHRLPKIDSRLKQRNIYTGTGQRWNGNSGSMMHQNFGIECIAFQVSNLLILLHRLSLVLPASILIVILFAGRKNTELRTVIEIELFVETHDCVTM